MCDVTFQTFQPPSVRPALQRLYSRTICTCNIRSINLEHGPPQKTHKRSIVSRSVFTCMHHNASIAPSSPNHQPKAGWLLQKPWGQPVRECQGASSQVGMETIDPPSDSGLPHGYFWCLHFCHLSIYLSIYLSNLIQSHLTESNLI